MIMRWIRRLAFWIQARSRRARFDFFMQVVRPGSEELILDLGGGSTGFLTTLYSNKSRFLLLDIDFAAAAALKRVYSDGLAVVADAQHLPFRDKAIDVIFSNSVIEHIPDQQAFAREIQRVGKAYFVQTPNKGFPMDSHYLIPFFQFLPIALQRFVYERIGGGWWRKQQRIYEPIHYLSECRLRQLFPDSEIAHERFLLMDKSFYCYRRMEYS